MAAAHDEPRSSARVPTRKARIRRRFRRLQQQKATEAQVIQWIDQYGTPGSGRLERPELEQLLAHLHPETGIPDPAALDRLVSQATEVRMHNSMLRGDPNSSIRQEMVMRICTGYSMYLLASVAIERRVDQGGVIALRDMPALLREANEGFNLDAREVDFVLDAVQAHAVGALDNTSLLQRDDLLTALQGVAMRFADEAHMRLHEEESRRRRLLDAIEQHTACGTPSTPSVDDNSDLYLEDLEGEIDGELAIQQQLASWRRRRAERIQAHFRRLVAVTYFKKARRAATIIQSAARSRGARILMLRRKAAADLITRIAKGAHPKRIAQKRRNAASTIGRIARGKVTRKYMRSVTQGAKQRVMAMRRGPAPRAKTSGDLGAASSRASERPRQSGMLRRSNTAPTRSATEPANERRSGSTSSGLCIVS